MLSDHGVIPMRNIFNFLRRSSTVILFLLLQGLAIWFLITYNKYYRAKGMGMANEVTGWFNTRYNTLEDFFRMKEENKRLLHLNDSLMNLLSSNFVKQDTNMRVVRDSLPFDTTGTYRQWIWRDAQVVYSTVGSPNNYIQINRGSNQGISDDMGVFSSDGGLVGKVVNVGPNFSQVMSLIHMRSNTQVMVKRTGSAGKLTWDGKDPRILTLSNISKSDSLGRGDTIVTGKYSYSYPPGHMVGTIEEIVPDNSTSFYVLRIKTKANFAELQQVMVVEDLQATEQKQLNRATIQKVEEGKKQNQ